MTGPELNAALARLMMTRIRLAVLTGVHRETVARWLRDEGAKGWLPVPVYVETILRQQEDIDELMSLIWQENEEA